MASGRDDYNGHSIKAPGLVTSAVDLAFHQVRRLPHLALRLPAMGAGFALVAVETLRQEARVQGTGVRTLLQPDAVRTAIKAGLDTVLPLADDTEVQAEAQKIAQQARETSLQAVAEARTTARESAAVSAATSEAAREVGAPGAATPIAEQAVKEAGVTEPPARQDLPIADFDNATLASLRARLRSLSIAELAQLRQYERAHAHRLPVITMLENRIAKLEADADSGANASAGTGDSAKQAAEQAAGDLNATVRP